jgi:hypothetical protein
MKLKHPVLVFAVGCSAVRWLVSTRIEHSVLVLSISGAVAKPRGFVVHMCVVSLEDIVAPLVAVASSVVPFGLLPLICNVMGRLIQEILMLEILSRVIQDFFFESFLAVH